MGFGSMIKGALGAAGGAIGGSLGAGGVKPGSSGGFKGIAQRVAGRAAQPAAPKKTIGSRFRARAVSGSRR